MTKSSTRDRQTAMKSHAQNRPVRHAARPTARTLTVCVVDANGGDYDGWREQAARGGMRLEIFSTAEDALRSARKRPVDLWVVNANLPGLSGFELCSMLKTQCSTTPVYLVTDEYSADQERRAWAARATLFACKPGHRELIGQWLDAQAHLQDAAHSEL